MVVPIAAALVVAIAAALVVPIAAALVVPIAAALVVAIAAAVVFRLNVGNRLRERFHAVVVLFRPHQRQRCQEQIIRLA